MKPIRAVGTSGPVSFDAKHVYFAFGSGRLTYDCMTCGSRKCCRGFGYQANPPELKKQLELRRSPPLFVATDIEHGSLMVHNCAPACFFLQDDGLCEVHAKFGYDAKPETCRLFPFNFLRQAGTYLIVRPHDNLCPLEVVRGREGSNTSEHDALFVAMAAQGLGAKLKSCAATDSLDGVIAHERRIVALSDSRADGSEFLDFVEEMAATEDSFGPGGSRDRLSATVMLVRELLGSMIPIAPDGEVARVMMAMTPFLRSLHLFPDVRPATPGTLGVDQSRLASYVAVQYLFAAAARAAGLRKATFQSISKTTKDLRLLGELMCWLDAVVVWKRGWPIGLSGFGSWEQRRAFARVARGLLASNPRSLMNLLMDHSPREPIERVLFLKEVARRLYGNVVPVGREREVPAVGNGFSRLRSLAQRWVLSNVNEELLLKVYVRKETLHI